MLLTEFSFPATPMCDLPSLKCTDVSRPVPGATHPGLRAGFGWCHGVLDTRSCARVQPNTGRPGEHTEDGHNDAIWSLRVSVHDVRPRNAAQAFQAARLLETVST